MTHPTLNVHDDAEQRFREALALHPDNPKVLARFAAHLVQQKRGFDEAERLFERAIELDPENPKLLGEFGTFLLRERNIQQEAEWFLRKALAKEPDNAAIAMELAEAIRTKRSAGPEIDTLVERALAREPTLASALLVKSWRPSQQPQEREALLREAHASAPDRRDITSALADFLASRKERDEAKDLYLRLLTSDQPSPWLILNAAQYFEGVLQDLATADQLYERLAIERPDVLLRSGLWILSESLEKQTRTPAAMERLAHVLFEKHCLTSRILARVLQFYSKRQLRAPEAWLLRQRAEALTVDGQGNCPCCDPYIYAQHYEAAFALDPSDLHSLLRFTKLLANDAMRVEQVAAAYRRCLEIDPDNEHRWMHEYVQFLERTRHSDQLLEKVIQRYIDLRPDQSIGWEAQGLLLGRRGELVEAERYLRYASDVQPKRATTAATLSQFLAETRPDDPEAEWLLQRALRQDPGNQWLRGKYEEFVNDSPPRIASAEAFFRRGMERMPACVQWPRYLAILLTDHARLSEAEPLFRHALELSSSKPEDHLMRGQREDVQRDFAHYLHYRVKRYDEAEAIYRELLPDGRKDIWSMGQLAILLWEQKQNADEAESLFKRALQYPDVEGWVAAEYADLLVEARGDLDGAIQWYRKAIEFDPEDPDHRTGLAKLLEQQRPDHSM